MSPLAAFPFVFKIRVQQTFVPCQFIRVLFIKEFPDGKLICKSFSLFFVTTVYVAHAAIKRVEMQQMYNFFQKTGRRGSQFIQTDNAYG